MVIKGLRCAARVFLDLVLPPRCVLCGSIQQSEGVCFSCVNCLTFFSEACCKSCGHPFESDFAPHLRCGACEASPPPLTSCRSVVVYNDKSRTLILRFKRLKQVFLARFLKDRLCHHGQALLKEADYVMPVPLHPRRLWWRGFNQSALLARLCTVKSHARYVPNVLKRVKSTKVMEGMNRAARIRNVQGAFWVCERSALKVRGKKILLIDDVYTTGATLHACAKVLLKKGAQSVSALTFARVCLSPSFVRSERIDVGELRELGEVG